VPRERKNRQTTPPPPTLEAVKESLSLRLPGLIGAAMAAYEGLAAGVPPTDPKDAAQHHGACKAALAHLDLLAKLARWAEGGERGGDPPDGTGEEDTESLLRRAQAALAGEEAED
jgi:hypothetical protein